MKSAKSSILVAMIFLSLAASLRADPLDDAEAKRRGVSVERVQLEHANERIAQLEKQLAEAKAATKPTVSATAPIRRQTVDVIPFDGVMKSIPARLNESTQEGNSPRARGEVSKILMDKYGGKRIRVDFHVLDVNGGIHGMLSNSDYQIECKFAGDKGSDGVFQADDVVVEGTLDAVKLNGTFVFTECSVVSVKPFKPFTDGKVH